MIGNLREATKAQIVFLKDKKAKTTDFIVQVVVRPLEHLLGEPRQVRVVCQRFKARTPRVI
jgi:hypothetical protein